MRLGPLVSIALALLLAGCTPLLPGARPDPAIQATRRACADVPAAERYACIEQQAVRALNPEICRLAGSAIDDACLQAVYQAAEDPSICERLYLRGVRPTCRAYYADAAAPGVEAAGMDRVCVSTGETNTPARRLYESVGFAVVNRYLDYAKPAG